MEERKIEEYNKKWMASQTGELSQEDWQKYCDELLFDLMLDNKAVFERLSKV